jgi:hypothetical protein
VVDDLIEVQRVDLARVVARERVAECSISSASLAS